MSEEAIQEACEILTALCTTLCMPGVHIDFQFDMEEIGLSAEEVEEVPKLVDQVIAQAYGFVKKHRPDLIDQVVRGETEVPDDRPGERG